MTVLGLHDISERAMKDRWRSEKGFARLGERQALAEGKGE